MGRLFSLTYPTAAVLLAIRAGHRYGFDVMDATGLPNGTVYPLLRRMERRGVLAGVWENEELARAELRPARRYYRLTKAGEAAMEDIVERVPALVRIFEGGAEPA
jgi:DNA-binding PadR family transcriptional regulator